MLLGVLKVVNKKGKKYKYKREVGLLQVNTDGRQVSGLNQNTVTRYSITTSFELFSHLVIIMHLL